MNKLFNNTLIINILFTLYYFSLTYLGSYESIASYDLLGIILLIAVVTLIQNLILNKVGKSLNNIAKNILLSFFIVSNIVSVNLIFNQSFITKTFNIKLLFLLLGFILIFFIINAIFKSRKLFNIFKISISFILLISFLEPSMLNLNNFISSNKTIVNYKNITFDQKPNVYIIGIDALVPKTLLSKHFDENTTNLHDLLDEHFMPYRNMFSGATRTTDAYASTFALTPELWDQFNFYGNCKFCDKPLNKYNFFNGLTERPFFKVFKDNGYTITTAFEWPHLGKNKGPYVDNYLTRMGSDGKRRKGGSFCNLLKSNPNSRSYRLGFFGYCNYRSMMVSEPNEKDILYYKGLEFNFAWDLRNIESISSSQKPQLFIGHILSPRHTSYEFNITDNSQFNDFKNNYINASNKTEKLLGLILEHINKNDPESIIFIWGDHGPILSNHLSWDRRSDTSSTNILVRSPHFFAQDRFGVYGGIKNAAICSNKIKNDRIYSTPHHALMDILYCISSKDSLRDNHQYFSTFTNKSSFPFPRRDSNDIINSDFINYEEHLYE